MFDITLYRHLRASYPSTCKGAREELHILSCIQHVAPAFIEVPCVHNFNHIIGIGIQVTANHISCKLWGGG